jgi:hypothetical protein
LSLDSFVNILQSLTYLVLFVLQEALAGEEYDDEAEEEIAGEVVMA